MPDFSPQISPLARERTVQSGQKKVVPPGQTENIPTMRNHEIQAVWYSTSTAPHVIQYMRALLFG